MRLERAIFWNRSKILKRWGGGQVRHKKNHPKVWSTICVYIYMYIYFFCRFKIWSCICLYGFFFDFHFENWSFIFQIGGSICLYVFSFLDFHFEIGSSICLYWFLFLDFHFENWSSILKKHIFEFSFWKCGLHMSIWISIFGFSFWKLKFYFESWFLFLNFHFENLSSICVYLFLFLDFYFEAWSFIGQGHEGKLMALASVWFSIFIFQCSTNNYALRVLLKFFTLNFKNTLAKRQPQSTATGHSREFPSGSGSHWFGSYMKGETNANFSIFLFFTFFR